MKRTRQISREDEWMKKGKVGEKFTCASHWSEKKKRFRRVSIRGPQHLCGVVSRWSLAGGRAINCPL